MNLVRLNSDIYVFKGDYNGSSPPILIPLYRDSVVQILGKKIINNAPVPPTQWVRLNEISTLLTVEYGIVNTAYNMTSTAISEEL